MPRLPLLLLAFGASLLIGCPGDKDPDTSGTITVGVPAGSTDSTPAGTSSGSTTSVQALYGCDPTYCRFTARAGARGGDMCTCTFPGSDHPTEDFVDASCFRGGQRGKDLTFEFDLTGLGYVGYSVNTCNSYGSTYYYYYGGGSGTDSSIAVYDADPLAGGVEVECSEDAGPGGCAQISDNAGDTPLYTETPASGSAWFVIDEKGRNDFWDGQTTQQIVFELFRAGVCGDGDLTPDEECDDGNTQNLDGCDASCNYEVLGTVPTNPGDLVITELMIQPTTGSGGGTYYYGSSDDDWFEVYNPGSTDANLYGCEVLDGATYSYTGLEVEFTSPVHVPAGQTVTVAHPGNPGFTPDFLSSQLRMNPATSSYGYNTEDGLILECGGVLIDEVIWDSTFPMPVGASIQLDPGATDHISNDDGTNWCQTNYADPGFTTGDLGNPGVVNPACPVTGAEICDDGQDNDLDVLVDCWDIDCVGDPACGYCGDGNHDPFEGCDDGNNTDGDGCDASCNKEPLYVKGCSPRWCTWSTGAGPNGGDLCECTIPASDHPVFDQDDADCAGGGGGYYYGGADTNDVIFEVDTAGYNSMAASTCDFTGTAPVPYYYYYFTDDSVLSASDVDPTLGQPSDFCNDNALFEPDGCSKIWDSQAQGVPAGLVDIPGGAGTMWFTFDERFEGTYWDQTTDRTFWFELSNTVVATCGDGAIQPGEDCDDGNVTDGDGCDATCQDEPIVIEGCDPTWCTLTAGGGPNGGDLCQCTFPPADHPAVDTTEGSCFEGTRGYELALHFDMAALGYGAYAVDTCAHAAQTTYSYYGYTYAYTNADSSVAVFDLDPWQTFGGELSCNEDAWAEAGNCSKVDDPRLNGAPALPLTARDEIWVVVDERYPAGFWDGTTDRIIDIELFQPDVCGNGSIGLGEECDDGNTNDIDGCSSTCQIEYLPIERITDCDPEYCGLSIGAGPHGGDICSCTIPSGQHPVVDDVEGTCFSNGGGSAAADLLLSFDMSGLGYTDYAVTTCTSSAGNSSLGAWDGNPASATELFCSDDATGETSGCSSIVDPGAAGTAATLTPAPASGELWIAVDEFEPDAYWDDTTDRVIEVELMWGGASTCPVAVEDRAPVPASGGAMWPNSYTVAFQGVNDHGPLVDYMYQGTAESAELVIEFTEGSYYYYGGGSTCQVRFDCSTGGCTPAVPPSTAGGPRIIHWWDLNLDAADAYTNCDELDPAHPMAIAASSTDPAEWVASKGPIGIGVGEVGTAASPYVGYYYTYWSTQWEPYAYGSYVDLGTGPEPAGLAFGYPWCPTSTPGIAHGPTGIEAYPDATGLTELSDDLIVTVPTENFIP